MLTQWCSLFSDLHIYDQSAMRDILDILLYTMFLKGPSGQIS
jgi:hypothetical protein